MKNIKKYSKFESKSDDWAQLDYLQVPLTDGPHSLRNIKSAISKYLASVYSPFGWYYLCKKEILIPDFGVIDSDYIDLFINNYTIWKKIINVYRPKDVEEFYNLVVNNLEKFYHYKSDFFNKNSLPIVIHTKRKGNRGERLTLAEFNKLAKSAGHNITLIQPTPEEDLLGIDAKFLSGARIYNIQVKPMSVYLIQDDKIYIQTKGCLTLDKYGISPDYLLFYDDVDYTIFLRNRNIVSRGDQFESSVKNLLERE